MNNFDFLNPVRIVFGDDQLSKLPTMISKQAKIMLLYGGGSIKTNGLYQEISELLINHKVIEFGGIMPNPTYEICMEAVEAAKKNEVDFLLAVGGGSVIDAAKFIAAAFYYNQGDAWDIVSKHTSFANALPIGAILTLPATGSEMNDGSVITRVSTNEKMAFSSPKVYPKFSFLAPRFCSSLPKHQIANGIVDAFVHTVEQYITYKVDAPLQDRIAESILQTLIEEGPKVYQDSSNSNAMANLIWSSSLALNGLIAAGVPTDWATHIIGHEITAIYNIDHAQTLAIVIPGLWKTLKTEKQDKLLQFAQRVWHIESGSDAERVDLAIEKTEEFFQSLGVKTHLSDYNVPKGSIETIVTRFTERGWIGFGDRNLATPEVIRKALTLQL